MAKGKYLRKTKLSVGKKIGRVGLVILLVLVILLGAIVAFAWSKLNMISYDPGSAVETIEPTSAVIDSSTDPVEETEPEEIVDLTGLALENSPNYTSGDLFKDKNVINILLIGSDEYTQGYVTNSRSDLNMIISINKSEKTVKLVSLSRGIAIKMLDGPYKGKYEWLTNAHRWAGHEAVLQALSDAFKIELDRYVRVNFQMASDVVNAIGGIEMEISEAEAKYFKRDRDWDFVVGMNTLSGWQALEYARCRAVDDDWGRVVRQRRCVLAVVDKLKGSSFAQLNDLCDMVLPRIQTNLTKTEIAELILYSPKFLESEFDQMTIPIENSYGGMTVMSGSGGWALDYEKNNAALHEFLYGVNSIG